MHQASLIIATCATSAAGSDVCAVAPESPTLGDGVRHRWRCRLRRPGLWNSERGVKILLIGPGPRSQPRRWARQPEGFAESLFHAMSSRSRQSRTERRILFLFCIHGVVKCQSNTSTMRSRLSRPRHTSYTTAKSKRSSAGARSPSADGYAREREGRTFYWVEGDCQLTLPFRVLMSNFPQAELLHDACPPDDDNVLQSASNARSLARRVACRSFNISRTVGALQWLYEQRGLPARKAKTPHTGAWSSTKP